jgi:hypothetical protein
MRTEAKKLRLTFRGLYEVEGESFRRAFFQYVAHGQNGSSRPISFAPIVSANLATRLAREAKPGDLLEVEIETRWDEPKIPTHMLNFSRLAK